MASLLGAVLCQADMRVQECSKYFPKISFDARVFLEMALQIMDGPDNFAAAQANLAHYCKQRAAPEQ